MPKPSLSVPKRRIIVVGALGLCNWNVRTKIFGKVLWFSVWVLGQKGVENCAEASYSLSPHTLNPKP